MPKERPDRVEGTQDDPVTTPTDETPVEAVTTASLDVLSLLERLVPPEGAEVVDIDGNRYRLPGALSANQQVRCLRILRGLSNLGVDDGTMLRIRAGRLSATELIGALAGLLDNEELLGMLDDAFEVAFPKVVRDVRERQGPNVPAVKMIDVFSIEDMVGSLVPFFARILIRGIRAFRTTPATPPPIP